MHIEDRGDYVVVRPVPDDPIEAAYGAFKERIARIPSEELRKIAREGEARIEQRKLRLYGIG